MNSDTKRSFNDIGSKCAEEERKERKEKRGVKSGYNHIHVDGHSCFYWNGIVNPLHLFFGGVETKRGRETRDGKRPKECVLFFFKKKIIILVSILIRRRQKDKWRRRKGVSRPWLHWRLQRIDQRSFQVCLKESKEKSQRDDDVLKPLKNRNRTMRPSQHSRIIFTSPEFTFTRPSDTLDRITTGISATDVSGTLPDQF